MGYCLLVGFSIALAAEKCFLINSSYRPPKRESLLFSLVRFFLVRGLIYTYRTLHADIRRFSKFSRALQGRRGIAGQSNPPLLPTQTSSSFPHAERPKCKGSAACSRMQDSDLKICRCLYTHRHCSNTLNTWRQHWSPNMKHTTIYLLVLYYIYIRGCDRGIDGSCIRVGSDMLYSYYTWYVMCGQSGRNRIAASHTSFPCRSSSKLFNSTSGVSI